MTTTYCTTDHVKALLQLSTLDANSNPSSTEVERVILRMEDRIDNITRHAWRTRYSGTNSGQDTTAVYETYDFRGDYEYQTGIPIYLKHRKVLSLDSDSGDALEFWNGSEYENWLSDKTEGRAEDFWVDYDRGILYVRAYFTIRKNQAFRIKYRYGEQTVNLEIEDLCAKMTAVDILTGMDPRAFIVQENSGVMSHSQRVDKWTKEIKDYINKYKEIQVPSIWN